MPSYRALVSFPHGKNRLAVGEKFEAKEPLGNFYIKAGMAEVAAGSPAVNATQAPKPKPVPPVAAVEEAKEDAPEDKKARKLAEKKSKAAEYERRDMTARAGRTGKAKA